MTQPTPPPGSTPPARPPRYAWRVACHSLARLFGGSLGDDCAAGRQMALDLTRLDSSSCCDERPCRSCLAHGVGACGQPRLASSVLRGMPAGAHEFELLAQLAVQRLVQRRPVERRRDRVPRLQLRVPAQVGLPRRSATAPQPPGLDTQRSGRLQPPCGAQPQRNLALRRQRQRHTSQARAEIACSPCPWPRRRCDLDTDLIGDDSVKCEFDRAGLAALTNNAIEFDWWAHGFDRAGSGCWASGSGGAEN